MAKGTGARDAAQAAASAKGCIKEAFLTMYEAASLKEIGAEALARKAGYSRAAFYRYFHSVADVLAELEDEVLPATQSAFIAQHAESITPSLFIGLYLDYFRENERELRILLARDTGQFYHKLERSITPAFYAMSASMYPISADGLESLTSYLVQTKMNQLRSWAHNPTQPLADYMRLPLETVERSFWKMDAGQ